MDRVAERLEGGVAGLGKYPVARKALEKAAL
jgi:hypothetical protein